MMINLNKIFLVYRDLLSNDPDNKESKIYETNEGQKFNPPLVESEITNEELILDVKITFFRFN